MRRPFGCTPPRPVIMRPTRGMTDTPMKLLYTALHMLPLLAMLSNASDLRAQTPEALPDAPDGTLVVAGRVTSVEARWDDRSRTIHSYVALDVARALLGIDVPSRLILEQLGGEVGGIGMWVAEQAGFRVGEDVLVVLTARPGDRSLHTVRLGRGKWTLDTSAIGGPVAGASLSQSGASPTISIADADRLLALRPRQALQAYDAAPPEFAAFTRQAAPAFALLPTDGGYPARWHEVDERTPVSVDLSPLPATWTHASPANATAAINLWRGSGMDLNLQQGGTFSGQCSAIFTGNGRIAVSYNDPCPQPISDWVVGGGYYTTGDLRTVNGTTFQKFIQGFVILDDTGPQSSSAGCFQDAVTHGLGHALGLGHTTSSGAIMQAGPNCGASPAGLGADDISGITAVYSGIASGPFPPAAPTNFSVTAALSTVALSWTPAATGGPAQRYIVDAGNTVPGVYNLGSTTFPASTTSTSVGGVPVGTYYLRVRAQNAIGTSPPSPERFVTVGACTPPSRPGTLTGSSLDTLVNLGWSAPTTGVTQGYQLAVGTAPGLANLGAQNYPATVTALSGPAPYGTYFVRVLATNVCGVSPPSNEVTLVVQPCAAAPQAPTGLAIAKSGTFLTITWNAPAGTPPTGYTLAVGSMPGLSNLAVLPTGNASTSLAGNAPPGLYYVRVIAQNACGMSGPSNEVFVTVP